MLILVGCTTVNELTSRVSETISPSSAVLTSDGLVIDSLKTLNILKNREDRRVFLTALQNAAGVAIFPAVYKAGFFVGAEGGNGLVIARDTHGNWGYPAFYTLAGGSWGIQFGGQRAGVVLIMRSRKAVEAVLKHQGKAGADLGIALGSIGTGLEGSTTTNLAADIFALLSSVCGCPRTPLMFNDSNIAFFSISISVSVDATIFTSDSPSFIRYVVLLIACNGYARY